MGIVHRESERHIPSPAVYTVGECVRKRRRVEKGKTVDVERSGFAQHVL